MAELVRRLPWPGADADEPALLEYEWLVTNGLGGYAAGSVAGVVTRRYHGLLVAALPAPLGRMVIVGHLWERVRLPDGSVVVLSGEERVGAVELAGARALTEFRLEDGLPVWDYDVRGVRLEKRVLMPRGQNTVYVRYALLGGDGPVRLTLRPSMPFRPHHAPVTTPPPARAVFTACEGRYEIRAREDLPPLRLDVHAGTAAFTVDARTVHDVRYRVEARRGYEAAGDAWSPGYFRVDLTAAQPATLVASTEDWDTLRALDPDAAWLAEHDRRRGLIAAALPEARKGLAAELVLAADQFIVTPLGRVQDTAAARAAGDEARSVVAGYHWFTDWGRDTTISLEGLTLTTGRHLEAGYILRTFAHYVRDGLIPNLFPEGEHEGLYHTADATLWFFHALDRYVTLTGDAATLARLLPTLRDIVDRHLAGTRFGIGVDDKDGLLRQGAPGYQLTWMDAKVDDWVVTPRRGKAVEINALWYNALRLLEGWLAGSGDEAAVTVRAHADLARRSFNERFWYAEGGYLYDVVDGEDGDDPACRPNQVVAIALRHPVLDRARWNAVIDTVRRRLLTPLGLRSLAPGHPDYKPRYDGDLRARDAAYHQGTVWPWLIGPFVDAWLRVHPREVAAARGMLAGFTDHLGHACISTISEIADAEPPFAPRGCVAQAWSVAEVLRAAAKVAGGP
ncbi:MAG TPA: amylo-alpha-1,6-glucosidase [Candidatus Tectomicrobia bacterium]|nr:amylo-alpha-1,6-glucosidase [Candidatus Tectomicrobia bacterium]